MSRNKTSKSPDKGNNNTIAIAIAIIGLVGTLITAYFGFRASTEPIAMIIGATQQALATATQSIPLTQLTTPVFLTPTKSAVNQPSGTLSPPIDDTKICHADFKCRLQNTGHNTDQACKDVIQLSSPYFISHIYIEMTEKGSEFGYSLWEVVAFRNNEKLNLTGVSTASSSEGLSFVGCNGAQCAIDNKIETRWGSDFVQDSSSLQWLDIILSEPVLLDRVELEWQTAYAKNYCITLR